MTAEGDSLIPKSAQHPPASNDAETTTLLYACSLTTFFFFVELIGGYLAGSLAIMSDAAHLMSDLAGFAISLLALSMSRLPANAEMSFGFARAEVLGAFVSILFIWVLTILLVIFAIERLFNPLPVDGPAMLILGIIGLLVNVVLGCVLGHHGHDHSHAHPHSDQENPSYQPIPNPPDHGHDHGHDHDHHNHAPDDTQNGPQPRVPKWRALLFSNDRQSVNLRAAYLHVLGDALQSVGVIIAAIIILFNPTWTFVDPLCTLVFAIIVVMTTMGLAKETLNVLMEGTPPTVQLDSIHQVLLAINGVTRIGDLHAWSITARRTALSVHLYQVPDADAHKIAKEARNALANRFHIFHATVQVNCDTLDCCDDQLAFDAEAQGKKCIPYKPLSPSKQA